MSLASHGYKRLRKLYQVTAQRMHVMQWLMEHGLHWGDQQPAKRSNRTLASVEGLEPRLLMSGQTQFIMSSLTGGDSGEGFTPKPAVSAAVDLAATNGTTYPLAVQGVNFTKLADSSNVIVSGATSGGTTDWYGIDSFGISSNDNNLEKLLVDRVGAGANVPWTITVTGLDNSKTYQVDLFSIDGGQQMKIWLGSDQQTAGYGGADYGVGSIFTAAGVFPTNCQIVVNVMGDSGGNSRINAISVTSDPGMPAAPSGLSATAASSTTINLAWTDNSIDETNFVIDRATDTNFTQNLVTSTVGSNVTTYSDTGLSALTTYYYRVRATNSVGDSANTSTASAQTPAPVQTVTLIPSQINANNTHAAAWGFSVNFDASAMAGATITNATLNLYPVDGYGVSEHFGFAPYTNSWLGTTGATTTIYSPGTYWGDPNPRQFDLTSIVQSWADGTVPNAGLYVTMPDNGLPVTDVTRSTLVVTYSMVGTAPTAPSNLAATTASTSQIDLAWVDNSNTETGFIIERATDAGFTQNVQTFTVGTNVTTYGDTGLSSATKYYYRVRAANSFGESDNSSSAHAATMATVSDSAAFVSMDAPTSMVAGQAYQVTVTMRNAGNNTWTTGGVWRLGSQSPQDNTNWGVGRVQPSADAGTCDEATFTFDISAPAVAGTYAFRWRMVHEYVQWFGDYTPIVTITVTGEPAMPVAPSALAATAVSANRIDLAWADNSSNETSFVIDRSTSADFTRNLTTLSVSPNTTSYSDTGLAAGTTYYYRIRSSNLAGQSENSTSASAVTAAVTGDSATFVGWNLPTTLVAGQTYQVTVTLRNTGSNTWTADGVWRLGSQSPDNNYNWGIARVQPDADAATGQDATFTFDIVAPAVAGSYTFNWRMVHEFVQWFGDSPIATLAVTGGPAIPTSASNLAATAISAGQIDLAWTDNSTNETSFVIERSTSPNFSRNLTTLTTAPNATAYSDTDLPPEN